MPHKPTQATQADIERAIRAMEKRGLKVARVVVRADGVAIETAQDRTGSTDEEQPEKDETITL